MSDQPPSANTCKPECRSLRCSQCRNLHPCKCVGYSFASCDCQPSTPRTLKDFDMFLASASAPQGQENEILDAAERRARFAWGECGRGCEARAILSAIKAVPSHSGQSAQTPPATVEQDIELLGRIKSVEHTTEELAALNRAIDRLRQSPPPVEGWQPIATAPKDGSLILGCHQGARPMAAHCVVWWRTEFDDWYSIDIQPKSPTHWMPLPASPRAQDDTPFFCERCGREFAQKPKGDCPDPGCGGEVFKGTP
jgi:hypothetical protein